MKQIGDNLTGSVEGADRLNGFLFLNLEPVYGSDYLSVGGYATATPTESCSHTNRKPQSHRQKATATTT